MKIPNSSGEITLSYFKDLYENAKMHYSETLASHEKHMSQYKGSPEIDNSSVKASTVRNITYEMIESQVSSDIPMPKVEAACYSERKDRCARSVERLLWSVRDRLPFEEMNDIDERYTYIYGGSVWYAEWDNEMKRGREVGGVRVYCLPPRCFVPQPGITSTDDMEYCFLTFTTTKHELARRYGVSYEDTERAETVGGDGECAEVIVTLFRDEDGEIGKFVFSGDLTLKDMPKTYHRKKQVCSKCGKDEWECRCKEKSFRSVNIDFEEISDNITLSDGFVISADKASPYFGKGRVPYYTPRTLPVVIRKNTSGDGMLFGQSDCEYVRPQQQAINKVESRILEKLLRAAVTPIMPEDATITPTSTVFGQVIRMKPGESAAQYGKVDTTPDITQDVIEAERLYDHAKRLLGISDALQGLDTLKNESGYSRQLRISQASGRLESKRRMKNNAYARLDRIIFELYLAFADEPRELIFRDAYGRVHNACFNKYDFVELDSTTGEYVFSDDYLFSADQNGANEYKREALWERNLENLKAGTLGPPDSNVTLLRYWQCQERAHYPYARENVEYFRLALEGEEVLDHGEENY